MVYLNTYSSTGAEPFAPHQFDTKQEILSQKAVPHIFILPAAYADMLTIAQLSGLDEIGWLGAVLKLDSNKYLIDRVFLFQQKVHGATTEITEDGLADFFTDVIAEDPELAQRIMFWGHVHPGNSTSPSSQDDTQMESFQHNPWFIRGIFGRGGRAEFTFFDYQKGIIWKDVPWQLHYQLSEELTAKWQEEIAAKVTKQIYMAPNTVKYHGGYQGPGRDLSELQEGAGDDVDDEGLIVQSPVGLTEYINHSHRSSSRPRRWRRGVKVVRLKNRDPQNVNTQEIIDSPTTESKVSPHDWPVVDTEPLCGVEPQGDECFQCVVKNSCNYFQTAIETAAVNSAEAQEMGLGAYVHQSNFLEGSD